MRNDCADIYTGYSDSKAAALRNDTPTTRVSKAGVIKGRSVPPGNRHSYAIERVILSGVIMSRSQSIAKA